MVAFLSRRLLDIGVSRYLDTSAAGGGAVRHMVDLVDAASFLGPDVVPENVWMWNLGMTAVEGDMDTKVEISSPMEGFRPTFGGADTGGRQMRGSTLGNTLVCSRPTQENPSHLLHEHHTALFSKTSHWFAEDSTIWFRLVTIRKSLLSKTPNRQLLGHLPSDLPQP